MIFKLELVVDEELGENDFFQMTLVKKIKYFSYDM